MPRTFFACCLITALAAAAFGGAYLPAQPVLSDNPTIKEVIGSPDYIGATVEISGVYRGNYSKIGPPPSTKSDYIVEDPTGQIFVSGPLPPGLKAKDLGQSVTIKGKVMTATVSNLGKKQKVIFLRVL